MLCSHCKTLNLPGRKPDNHPDLVQIGAYFEHPCHPSLSDRRTDEFLCRACGAHWTIDFDPRRIPRYSPCRQLNGVPGWMSGAASCRQARRRLEDVSNRQAEVTRRLNDEAAISPG